VPPVPVIIPKFVKVDGPLAANVTPVDPDTEPPGATVTTSPTPNVKMPMPDAPFAATLPLTVITLAPPVSIEALIPLAVAPVVRMLPVTRMMVVTLPTKVPLSVLMPSPVE